VSSRLKDEAARAGVSWRGGTESQLTPWVSRHRFG